MVSDSKSISRELTDEELECVIGGASPELFNKWKVDIVNEHLVDRHGGYLIEAAKEVSLTVKKCS